MIKDDVRDINNIDLKTNLIGSEVQFEGLDSSVINDLLAEFK